MLELAALETWVGLGVAGLTLLTAILKLVTVLQERRKTPTAVKEGAPEAQAVVATRSNLLPDRPPFVNRKREMGELISRARGGRVNALAIEGDPLVGKSAVAKELVHSLIAEPGGDRLGPADRDFVWINARDRCPSLAELCERLSLLTEDQSLTTETDKRERLRLHLARNKTVLVLDNLLLADGDANSSILVDFLAEVPSDALIIATVNTPGSPFPSRVPLRDLELPHVRDLIRDCVKRFSLDGSAQFDDRFAERLHDVVGGNPGVIEWFLRGYQAGSGSLEERMAELERGHNLAELFEPTWDGLEVDEQEVLRACAHLRGEATSGQVAVACDLPEERARALTDALHRKGALTPMRAPGQPVFFACPQAFRRFAASQTDARTRLAFTRRLADAYIRHFTANPEDARSAVSEVGALRLVREELFRVEDDARMQALFTTVLDVLLTLGQFDEVIAFAELAALSAERIDGWASLSLAMGIKACTHAMRGELEAARAACSKGSVAAEASGLPGPVARLQRCRGFVHYRSREPRLALEVTEGTEQLARAAHDGINVVDTLDLRTAASWYAGDVDGCEAAARASLKQGEEMGWGRARAYPLRFLAEVALQRGGGEEARRLLAEAGAVAERFGDQRQLARVELTRARLSLLEGSPGEAITAATNAVTEATRLGLPAERCESAALAKAAGRAARSRLWSRYYELRRPSRMTDSPVGGD
jgi:hypothetical protein